MPWGTLRARAAIVSDVRVTGTRYLDPAPVIEVAAIRKGDDLFRIDRARARQALLLQPRIHEATVGRFAPSAARGRDLGGGARAGAGGAAWGAVGDRFLGRAARSTPARGVTADVPLLIGSDLDERLRPGTHVRSPEVLCAAWRAPCSPAASSS